MLTAEQRRKLAEICNGRVEWDVPMARHTTLRVGGPAEGICSLLNLRDLLRVLSFARQECIPWRIVGRGSNLLVRDSGIEGLVLLLRGDLAAIGPRPGDPDAITGGGGLPLSLLMRYCLAAGLSGLEYLVGIPGTLGGAASMNAGAFGCEIRDNVLSLRILPPDGMVRNLELQELKFGYRSLTLPAGAVILQAHLRAVPGPAREVRRRMQEFMRQRRRKQPWQWPSAGSVFKNPPGDSAGRLIEAAGLKSRRVGGAMVSERHANFIINIGNASAADVLALMETMRSEVRMHSGIELDPEIEVLGNNYAAP